MAALDLQPATVFESADTAEAVPFRFTREQFHRLDGVDTFRPNDRVELIAGRIMIMNPIGGAHSGSVMEVARLFSPLWDQTMLWVQCPIAFDEETELVPDFALIRRDGYRAGNTPRAEAVLLLVEVAQTSAAYDRDLKQPIYARFGIPEYWSVDLKKRRLTVHGQPAPQGYKQKRTYKPGDTIAPAAFPEFSVPVGNLFPG